MPFSLSHLSLFHFMLKTHLYHEFFLAQTGGSLTTAVACRVLSMLMSFVFIFCFVVNLPLWFYVV